MDTRLDRFFSALRNKKVLVIGIGISNTPVIELLAHKGVSVTVCDKKSRDRLGDVCVRLESWGARLLVGEDYPRQFDADLIIRAPGVYYNSPMLLEARRRGIAVTSEMELFFDFCPCPVYAVTGSEGKTTTASVTAALLEKQGKLVHLGGNIGRCLFGDIESIAPNDVAVAELSSFQLISMRRSPDVAALLNISPNHLDIHPSMDEYICAKKNIFLHQNAFGRCVLNADNPITASFASECRGDVLTFSRLRRPERGMYFDGESIYYVRSGDRQKIVDAADITIPGLHNIENYMAAFASVWGAVDIDVMRAVASSFKGVEHRMEFVRELNGVRYYNDSIATSPTRVIAGLRVFRGGVVLIAGGYDKKIPFEPLAGPVCETCKAVILTGDTSEKISAAITSCPEFNPEKLKILFCSDLSAAVFEARKIAEPGDTVTLSPACASFDRYANFEERGNDFKKIVKEL